MRRKCLAIIALCCLLLGNVSLRSADEPKNAKDPQAELKEKLIEFAKLQQELASLFSQKDWEKAADVCRKQMKVIPQSGEPHYNLACCMARLGKKDEALAELEQAVNLGFTDTAHMKVDDDLTTLREEDRYKDLIKKARDKELNAPHEKGEEIAGVKMIEGFPEGGLRYRLRIDPKADEKKPAHLLIWLHPSGGSMDNVVEKMSPEFAKDGYALLVFTQKNYMGWSGEDVTKMIGKTLPEIAKIPGVDVKRPVLIGFSAGGQLALQLWSQHPGQFGGMILDAAYPIDPVKFAQRQLAPVPIPKEEGAAKCPVFVLVGGNDNGSSLWKQVDKSWRDAKVPLTVHIIPGKQHQWLVDAPQATAIHAWLKRVAAGELPSEEMKDSGPEKDHGPSIKI